MSVKRPSKRSFKMTSLKPETRISHFQKTFETTTRCRERNRDGCPARISRSGWEWVPNDSRRQPSEEDEPYDPRTSRNYMLRCRSASAQLRKLCHVCRKVRQVLATTICPG